MAASWVCSQCGGLIDDGMGYLGVRMYDAQTAEERRIAWEAEVLTNRKDTGDSALEMYSLREHASRPPAVPWTAMHTACDIGEQLDYTIGVDKLRNAKDLLAWTAHLMGKVWLDETDWRKVLERALPQV